MKFTCWITCAGVLYASVYTLACLLESIIPQQLVSSCSNVKPIYFCHYIKRNDAGKIHVWHFI